ncbi:EAL domain-containing protein [Noviherbaspirillum sp. CPCC 100848]|uniref:EAL domain-containing protein n=1 Tax=Noviherbaspirillum album TaxID=3080276 RepID=A0ABU6J6S7_9BURK|nr:EAL domain-containing protein [Noviherbaspirillum sp. CPCC 100848]MEC4718889.1 EAL domain-containing protein [Noviherbaspirillum sp. CPCC 100848]
MLDADLTTLLPHGADEDLFRQLFRKHGSVMLLIAPETGAIVDANPAAVAFYGYPRHTMRGMQIGRINIQSEQEIRGEMQQALDERRSFFIFRHRLASAEVRTVEVHSTSIEIGGRPLLFSIVFDITERQRVHDSLRLASLVYQKSSEAMSVIDGNGVIININPAFTEITGYTEAQAIGRNIRMLKSQRESPEAYTRMWKSMARDGRWQGELWGRRSCGRDFLLSLTLNSIHHDDGSIQCNVGLFSDITKKRETDELIWRQANFDTLTGLPNRSMFHDRLEQAMRKANRGGQQVALLFLDLDFFKEVNDTLGHSMGDRLLQEAARRVCSCVRETDTVARLGGDEFTVILEELSDSRSVERAVGNILRELTEPFQLGAEQVYISASIGITFYPADGRETDTLLKNADQAMYAAKAQGRNRYSYFTTSMQEAAQQRKRLITDLRIALHDKQFRVYYQPIIDLDSGRICKAEALIRWQHPVRGLISPAEFIPVAEETGMIVELGEWIFRQAARQVGAWRTRHDPAFQISVNVSPVQLQSEGVNHESWLGCMESLQLPGQSMVVEITEGMLMDSSRGVPGQLLRFRDNGVQAALDDFGTGYSSLSYLKKFDIDYIKIDKSFVQNLAPGSDDMALCEAIIVMAHKLGIKVVAEGVETETQRRLLAASKCDYAQGYLFSRPVPAEEFEHLF